MYLSRFDIYYLSLCLYSVHSSIIYHLFIHHLFFHLISIIYHLSVKHLVIIYLSVYLPSVFVAIDPASHHCHQGQGQQEPHVPQGWAVPQMDTG